MPCKNIYIGFTSLKKHILIHNLISFVLQQNLGVRLHMYICTRNLTTMKQSAVSSNLTACLSTQSRWAAQWKIMQYLFPMTFQIFTFLLSVLIRIQFFLKREGQAKTSQYSRLYIKQPLSFFFFLF